MDDQATKLRQLVRTVRHAATVATGPPLLLVYAPANSSDARQLHETLFEVCTKRGLRLSTSAALDALPEQVDWQLVQVVGDFRTDDHDIWHRASALIVAVHDDDESVVECYKRLKIAHQHTPLPPIELVILCEDYRAEVDQVAERLAQTCQRFLLSSVAGRTVIDSTSGATAAATATLVDRLLMMAPVASGDLNSPIAAHQP